MVELPRKDVFESAGQAELILADETARAPVAEAAPMPVAEAPVSDAPKKAGRAIFKRAVVAAALLAGVALSGDFGYRYWTVGRFIESTDDAYVKADYTTVAPKVAGYIRQFWSTTTTRSRKARFLPASTIVISRPRFPRREPI
jgi:membrane fusion protein (multidrug efflux system)